MKYSKSQDTPQRAHSPSLFPALMLLPVAFQPHFILQLTDHPSSRALLCSAALPRADVSPTHWLCPSPWGGVPSNLHLPLLQGNLSAPLVTTITYSHRTH